MVRLAIRCERLEVEEAVGFCPIAAKRVGCVVCDCKRVRHFAPSLTHSLAFSSTPFLWPFSDIKVDGISWHTPAVLIPNVLLLLGAYAWWVIARRRRNRAAEIAERRTER